MNFFDIILIDPILNVMVAIYQLLVSLHVPSALGFSIVLLTIVIRLILYPLMHQSLRQQKKMQQLTPHINKLKEKHKNDAKRLQVEQMALFKEHGVNPAAGCLIMIVQIPILIGLYRVLILAVNSKSLTDINNRLYFAGLKLHHVWDTNFFGVPLAHAPKELWHQLGIGVVLLAILTAALQLAQSRMMMPTKEEMPKPVKKADDQPDFATTFQTQSMYMMPLMVGFLSFIYPFGLSLYWNTLTIFGIIQQYIISGWGGLADWLPFLKKTDNK